VSWSTKGCVFQVKTITYSNIVQHLLLNRCRTMLWLDGTKIDKLLDVFICHMIQDLNWASGHIAFNICALLNGILEPTLMFHSTKDAGCWMAYLLSALCCLAFVECSIVIDQQKLYHVSWAWSKLPVKWKRCKLKFNLYANLVSAN